MVVEYQSFLSPLLQSKLLDVVQKENRSTSSNKGRDMREEKRLKRKGHKREDQEVERESQENSQEAKRKLQTDTTGNHKNCTASVLGMLETFEVTLKQIDVVHVLVMTVKAKEQVENGCNICH